MDHCPNVTAISDGPTNPETTSTTRFKRPQIANVNKHIAKARARVRLARLSGSASKGAKNRRRGSL